MSSKTWEVMNELEMVTSKICSAREILDCAIDAHQKHKNEKVEHLLYAVDEFLQYYLQEFDEKFKKAWKETVVAEKELLETSLTEREYYEGNDDGMRPWGHSDIEYAIANSKKPLSCDKDDSSPECQGAWNDFWEENYYPEEYKKDKVKKWLLPIEEVKDEDTDENIYCVSFPDDLLEAADLKEGDLVEWVDLGDGSYRLEKVPKAIRMDEC